MVQRTNKNNIFNIWINILFQWWSAIVVANRRAGYPDQTRSGAGLTSRIAWAPGLSSELLLPNRIKNYMGLSENSVPLHPMVNDHYPYYKKGL